MTTKKLIVIVPGSKAITSGFRFVDRLLDNFYAHFGVDTEDDDRWTLELKATLERDDPATEVRIFHWSGGFTPRSLKKAAMDLRSVLDSLACPDTTLFCKSLGGRVGELAAQYWGCEINLVEVATPHGPFERRIPRARITNVYSLQDKYLTLGNKVLYLGLGKTGVKYGKNVCLAGISHSGFNRNAAIHHNGETIMLFEFYRQLINADQTTLREGDLAEAA